MCLGWSQPQRCEELWGAVLGSWAGAGNVATAPGLHWPHPGESREGAWPGDGLWHKGRVAAPISDRKICKAQKWPSEIRAHVPLENMTQKPSSNLLAVQARPFGTKVAMKIGPRPEAAGQRHCHVLLVPCGVLGL